MNIQEAKDLICQMVSNMQEIMTREEFEPYDEAGVMAIEALEKLIPKKIVYRKQYYGTPWLCYECEAEQEKVEFMRTDGYEPQEKHSYCWHCGQKIDWSEAG